MITPGCQFTATIPEESGGGKKQSGMRPDMGSPGATKPWEPRMNERALISLEAVNQDYRMGEVTVRDRPGPGQQSPGTSAS